MGWRRADRAPERPARAEPAHQPAAAGKAAGGLLGARSLRSPALWAATGAVLATLLFTWLAAPGRPPSPRQLLSVTPRPAPSRTASPSAATVAPTIQSLVPSTVAPGLVKVPEGPFNGPLTAGTFRALSADPVAGAREFARWSAQQGFAAWIRTFKDRAASGVVQVELFRFPDQREAASFTAADAATFAQVGRGQTLRSSGSLPAIPGSLEVTVALAPPTAGTVQGVLFRSTRYVCIVNTVSLASTSGSGVPTGTAGAVATAESRRLSHLGATPG